MQADFTELEILDLLNKVKIFNPRLGDLQLFTINEQFLYVIKLTNGTIHFSVDELIANRMLKISANDLANIAARFVSSEDSTVQNIQSPQQVVPHPSGGNRLIRNITLTLFGVISVLLAVAYIAMNYTSRSPGPGWKDEIGSEPSDIAPDNYQVTPKTEEELKQEIYSKELENPNKYIDIRFRWHKKILLDQMVFDGTITNSASLVNFRNFNITLKAYSDTDYLLEERNYVITEEVGSTGSGTFKLRTAPWDGRTERFEMVLNGAEGN